MVYITGDTHRDFNRIYKFYNDDNIKENDTLIIAGDFGGIWADILDDFVLDDLSKLPFNILFIDGNHENFNLLNSYDEIDYCGGRAHKIRDNIYHLMRGYIFTIEDKNIFVFGGADSVDKEYRIEYISWWREEMPNKEEMDRGLDILEERDCDIDYVITHDCPSAICRHMSKIITEDEDTFEVNVLNKYLDEVNDETPERKVWYFGHYHIDRAVELFAVETDETLAWYRALYKDILLLGEK